MRASRPVADIHGKAQRKGKGAMRELPASKGLMPPRILGGKVRPYEFLEPKVSLPLPPATPAEGQPGASRQRIDLPNAEPFDVARDVVEPEEGPGSRPRDELHRAVVEGCGRAAVDARVGRLPAPGVVGLG